MRNWPIFMPIYADICGLYPHMRPQRQGRSSGKGSFIEREDNLDNSLVYNVHMCTYECIICGIFAI